MQFTGSNEHQIPFFQFINLIAEQEAAFAGEQAEDLVEAVVVVRLQGGILSPQSLVDDDAVNVRSSAAYKCCHNFLFLFD